VVAFESSMLCLSVALLEVSWVALMFTFMDFIVFGKFGPFFL
jgi:hypothetical protein